MTIHVEGLDRLIRDFGRGVTAPIRAATRAIAEVASGRMSVYPGHAASPVQWASDRQRRYYFAMRRAAGAPNKYTRQNDPMSQRLKVSWTTARVGDFGALAGTRTDYAPHVQSEEDQSAQHKATGWTTDEKEAKKIESDGTIPRAFTKALRHHFGGN